MFLMTSAVIASPRRALAGSGKLANGHCEVRRRAKCFATSRLNAGVNPFLIFAMKISAFPS